MTFLETCAVNKSLLEQVEIAMEEAILTDFWVDVAVRAIFHIV